MNLSKETKACIWINRCMTSTFSVPRTVSHINLSFHRQVLSQALTAIFLWLIGSAPGADGDLNLSRSFVVQPSNAYVSVLAKAPDGKLVGAGPFLSINGQTSPKVIRFYQNGTVDPTFVSPGRRS